MYNCIVKTKPASFNSWRKKSASFRTAYKEKLKTAFSNRYTFQETPLSGDLYGIAYYFHTKEVHPDQKTDADNLSKPIWDGLKKFLYDDDEQIKLCIAGCIDLTEYDLTEFDITTLPEELIETILNEPNTLYLECGNIALDLFKFNLANHANQ